MLVLYCSDPLRPRQVDDAYADELAGAERAGFDELLAQAVPSSYDPTLYASEAKWRQAVQMSDVRMQWDPDHDPAGRPLVRGAIQLGLRGEALRRYACEELLGIEDISPFVGEQRQHALTGNWTDLMTPRERIYPVGDAGTE